MSKNVLYVGKGKRNASPIFCFSASCSNLVSVGSYRLSTERPAQITTACLKEVDVTPSPAMMLGSPTVELHGDLATFLVIYDGVGAVVSLPDHDVSVQLCTCSCSVQQRRTACNKQCRSKGEKSKEGYLLAPACPGLARDCRPVRSPNTGDYWRKPWKRR